jgi:glycosyltransferase involved in cell wall biosynthesis
MTICDRPKVFLTLNKRFVLNQIIESHPFGVIGFVVSIVAFLASEKLLGGIILYNRDEALTMPILETASFLDIPSIELRFNFRIRASELRNALRSAVLTLDRDFDIVHTKSRCTRVIYHQSNTLVPFTPEDMPFLVTHHGPFAQEICRIFGKAFAIDAFQGGINKVDHLIRMQRLGIAKLRRSAHGAALEMSQVQEHLLLQYGVPSDRVYRIPPPICRLKSSYTQTFPIPDHSLQKVELITAVARIDHFKNLRLLIEAANHLAYSGVVCQLSIFAGSEKEEPERQRLYELLCKEMRTATRIAPRLAHSALLSYFNEHRAQGIFVCTSLYETFGLTVMEAILAGLVTLVPDEPSRIGVLEYMSPSSRYVPTTDGLICKLREVISEEHRISLYHEQRDIIRQSLEKGNITRTIVKATYDIICRSE